jgi:MFS family permease
LNRRPDLLRRRPWNYRGIPPLVGAVTISGIGTEITAVALPLIAINVLRLGDIWVSALEAIAFVAVLLFPLPVGMIADRCNRKVAMIAADLCSFAVLSCLLILWFIGQLQLTFLMAGVLGLGFFQLLNELCSETVMPDVVPDNALDSCNGLLTTFRSVASVAGPGFGGVLISALNAFAGLVVDATSFLLSALMLSRVPLSNTSPKPEVHEHRGAQRIRSDLAAGFSVVRSDERLMRILGSSATSNLFSTMAGVVEVLFLVRVLHVEPWGVGAAFSVTAIGGIAGGLILGRLRRRFGPIRIITVTQLLLSAPILLPPLATPGPGIALYLFGWFFYALSSVIYATAVVTYRQRTVPRQLLGRVSAVGRWINGIAMTVGAAAAAVMVGVWGIRTVVLVSSIGIYVSSAWLLSPAFFSRADDVLSPAHETPET